MLRPESAVEAVAAVDEPQLVVEEPKPSRWKSFYGVV